MAAVKQKEILPGVQLTWVQTNQFKTCMLGLTLLAPMDAGSASVNALIPMVLRRGTQKHPDMQAISAALDELYGGSLEPMVRKKGETQCVGFVGTFLDDRYTPDGSEILERPPWSWGRSFFPPPLRKGAFRPDYVRGERANLIDRIRAQVNDKRQYSMLRLTRLMCEGEPYGIDKFGEEEAAAAITGKQLWDGYHALLANAPVELYYCGSALSGVWKKPSRRRWRGCPVRSSASNRAVL
jgi:hypothetical protein